ncbi:haloacid dehalogenase [Naviculisporaceae sp. PSN 640]
MSSPSAAEKFQHVKGLTFDVFGTAVDWRTTVTDALIQAAADKAKSPEFSSLPQDLQTKLNSVTKDSWGDFAQEWRNSYGKFILGFVPGKTPWKDIDAHHHDSLLELLDKWHLSGIYSPEELEKLSKVWHFLAPWTDASEGLHTLGKRFVVATLSNGNQSLLADLNEFGKLGFQRLISAEDFRAYKPNPATYLGACKALGFEPSQVAMVAAHLGDLAAARTHGLKTIYVERNREEDWDPEDERYRDAKGWVDLWITQEEGGFIEVARRLGL